MATVTAPPPGNRPSPSAAGDRLAVASPPASTVKETPPSEEFSLPRFQGRGPRAPELPDSTANHAQLFGAEPPSYSLGKKPGARRVPAMSVRTPPPPDRSRQYEVWQREERRLHKAFLKEADAAIATDTFRDYVPRWQRKFATLYNEIRAAMDAKPGNYGNVAILLDRLERRIAVLEDLRYSANGDGTVRDCFTRMVAEVRQQMCTRAPAVVP